MKEIEEFKPILSNILKIIDEFCASNNLRYSLAYGTLIGAVRHGGFIPWDDDIDIMMPRPDYEIFIKSFNHSTIKLIDIDNSRDYVYPFAKVYDTKTIIQEQSDLVTPFGLYVDIFPIDGMPSNKLIRRFHSYYFHLLKELISVKNMSSTKDRSVPQKILVKIFKWIFSTLPVNAVANLMNRSTSLFPYKNSKIVGNLLWESYGIKGFNKDIFESYISLKFEDLQVKSISEYNYWLKVIYGDYMKLPPKEKRISNHTFKAYLK